VEEFVALCFGHQLGGLGVQRAGLGDQLDYGGLGLFGVHPDYVVAFFVAVDGDLGFAQFLFADLV
jgi:hypothetical protein